MSTHPDDEDDDDWQWEEGDPIRVVVEKVPDKEDDSPVSTTFSEPSSSLLVLYFLACFLVLFLLWAHCRLLRVSQHLAPGR